MKSVNSLINNIKNHISNNDSVKKIEEATNKILHKEDKEVSCCNNTDNKNTEKVDELNKIQIVQPSSSSIFNRSDDIYHLFRPQDNINSYDSSLIMRNVDKCKGTNENIKNSKRIQLYKNKGDISNFNTTIRTNLNKFKIDLSKDLRYKFLNKYGAKDDFNFDIYIFPPPPGTIPSGYYQIPGDITKWRTAYQEKWVSSGGTPDDRGWYSNTYWEGNWTSYNTLYYTANFMEYSPTTGKFSNIRSYSVPIRYGATEYHGGTSGSGAYTTHYSGRYSDIGNRGNDYWPPNFSLTFTPPEYIEGWTLYEHSGNIYKYKKTEYGAEIKTTETNTSGKKNGVTRAPNVPDYVSYAASRDYDVTKLGNSYQIIYWTESRTKTITPQYNYRMSFDCTTGTFSNPVYDYIENVNYSSWYGSGIAYLGSSTNAWHANFTWSRNR